MSSIVVWLSNNPGSVEIIWKNYLIETDLFGLTLVTLVLIVSILISTFLFPQLKIFRKIYNPIEINEI